MLHPNAVAFRIMLYGVFLVLCGLSGFILTAEHSTSALMNGIVGGLLMIVLGVMHRQRRAFTLPAALGSASIFTVTFVWRSTLQWYHSSGDGSYLPLALLLTGMTVVSLVMVLFLYRHIRL